MVSIDNVNIAGDEESPAYKSLREAGLIVDAYHVASTQQIDAVTANSDVGSNLCRLVGSSIILPVLGGIVYKFLHRQFSVREGHVRLGTRADGSYMFFGPGVHRIRDPFLSVGRCDEPLTSPRIEHGNRAIVTVSQGFIGLAFDQGQPIILPPGIHQWKSDTLKFKELIDLSDPVIRIGPLTLLTVDEGYAAVTQDNGKQCVLAGGNTHMLTHRNWKFESFISLKIHTDDLGPFSSTTADNVVLETTAMVNWRIEDPALAALMATETMPGVSSSTGSAGRSTTGTTDSLAVLRRDVLKQALGSLSATIGSIMYSGDKHVSADKRLTLSEETADASRDDTTSSCPGLAQMFSVLQMAACAKNANNICSQYGVRVVNINVVSAFPKDEKLAQALSQGAVASASAAQAEVAARGNARARLIAAQSEADAVRIEAQAASDGERIRAEGKKEAAALLEASAVAVDLAKMERAGEVIGSRTTIIFGASPHVLPAMMSNPKFAPFDGASS
mmetsp:Transcript_123950/g.246773  ORF Transcript_123950/g.246773 Transcript_123950/m.246773 type:complete len:503 (+) Transcript_123950:49-1557(+)